MTESEAERSSERRDIEAEKLRFFWDYHRTRIYSTLTMLVSLFVGTLVILNSLQIAGRVPFQVAIFLVYFIIVLYMPLFLIQGVLVKNKLLILETDKLLEKLAKSEPLGDFDYRRGLHFLSRGGLAQTRFPSCRDLKFLLLSAWIDTLKQFPQLGQFIEPRPVLWFYYAND